MQHTVGHTYHIAVGPHPPRLHETGRVPCQRASIRAGPDGDT